VSTQNISRKKCILINTARTISQVNSMNIEEVMEIMVMPSIIE